MKTVFLRSLEAEDKSAALLRAIRAPDEARGMQRFEVEPASFASVPRSPFAYWVSSGLRELFTKVPALSQHYLATRGAYTTNDFRFYLLSWEVDAAAMAQTRAETKHGKRFVPLAKGGAWSRYYHDVYLAIRWGNDGAEPKAFLASYRESKGWGTDWSACLNGYSYYFRPGLTWPLRTQSGLSMRAMPAGCIFGHKGPVVFVANDDGDGLLAVLAAVNCTSFRALVDLQMAFGSFEVGVIQRTPIPEIALVDQAILATLARRAWSLKRSLDTRSETSHAFTVPALLQVEGATLAERSAAWSKRVSASELDLYAIQSEIDTRGFDLYGINDVDRRAITEGFSSSAGETAPDTADPDTDGDAESEADESEDDADAATLTAELVSWAVGAAFGRFDVRLATGARPLPPEPEPFDALPVCSPAMLTGDDGLPLAAAPAGYPLKWPEDGILVDDPGHPRDLTAAVRAVFDVVFGDAADARWNEAAALLDPREHDLRNWLAKGFFEQHLKRHSKSRRKAPILWQLATASSSYAVWLYAHRINKDTFFQVQNDLVAQKLFHEERRQTTLEQAAGPSPSASQRKELAAQATLLEELRTLLGEVKRIAALWHPNLDDGVVLTMAPLWRLVPQYKPWQKELKAAWDGLAAGKFDWAHLAMHLWPERVVPKCATDRSLAIAHGLEDVFWVEVTEGKWKARPAPTRSVDELVRERTSAAVKASLKSLVEASIGGGGAKRGRKSRTHD